MTSEDLIRILTQVFLFIGAAFLGVFVAPDNPALVLIICFSLFALIFLGRFSRDTWILFPLAGGFSGTINLIPGGLTLLNLVCVALAGLTLYFLKADPQFRFR